MRAFIFECRNVNVYRDMVGMFACVLSRDAGQYGSVCSMLVNAAKQLVLLNNKKSDRLQL